MGDRTNMYMYVYILEQHQFHCADFHCATNSVDAKRSRFSIYSRPYSGKVCTEIEDIGCLRAVACSSR